MEPRYNYKLWNPNLSQFVAQPNLLTAGEIHALGGVVIPGSSIESPNVETVIHPIEQNSQVAPAFRPMG
jgi:hypothetical protein